MKDNSGSHRVRFNVTMDRELLGYLDALVKVGGISQGRRVYRSRAAALEYIVSDFLEARERAVSASAEYILRKAAKGG